MKIEHSTMIQLANYPVLARLAARRCGVGVVRLDARACRFVYEAEMTAADLAQLDAHELELMEALVAWHPSEALGGLLAAFRGSMEFQAPKASIGVVPADLS